MLSSTERRTSSDCRLSGNPDGATATGRYDNSVSDSIATSPTPAAVPARGRPGTTVVFTDIVGSTRLAAEIGDAAWADLLEHHHAVVRSLLERHGGREMDTTGDGFFAVFDDPESAIACACDIHAELRRLDLQVRIGAHAGDCFFVGPKCVGLAVNIGARLAELAGTGEILVSQPLAETLGERFLIEARGDVELRGVPGRWRTFAVAPRRQPR